MCLSPPLSYYLRDAEFQFEMSVPASVGDNECTAQKCIRYHWNILLKRVQMANFIYIYIITIIKIDFH